MKILKKIRPSRLFNFSAWTAVLNVDNLFVIGIMGCLTWVMASMPEAFYCLWIVPVLIGVMLILKNVTMPYDFFEIELENQRLAKVYVYKQRNKFFIEVLDKEHRSIKDDDYIKQENLYFLYQKDGDWFYLGVFHNTPKLFGKRIGETIFAQKQLPIGKNKVSFWEGAKGFMSFECDDYFTEKNGLYVISNESHVANKQNVYFKENIKKPKVLRWSNTYILLKNKGTYTLYSAMENCEHCALSRFAQVAPAVVVLKENDQVLILASESSKKELSVLMSLNSPTA